MRKENGRIMESEIDEINEGILSIINEIVDRKLCNSEFSAFRTAIDFAVDTINKNIEDAREALNEFAEENPPFNDVQQVGYLLACITLKEELIAWNELFATKFKGADNEE